MDLSADLIEEQGYLVSRGVRALALLESVSKDEADMRDEFLRVKQIAVRHSAIPFVLKRKDMDCAMVGFASHQWVINLLEWSYNHAPLREHHRIIRLLLGYSTDAIAEHDDLEFAGNPSNNRSMSS